MDGFVGLEGDASRADGLLHAGGAAVRLLARQHVHARQSLVLLDARTDLPEPPLPAGRHRLRRRPSPASEHAARSPRRPMARSSTTSRPSTSAGGLLHRSADDGGDPARSSSSTSITTIRSASSSTTAKPAACRRSASSTPRLASCRTLGGASLPSMVKDALKLLGADFEALPPGETEEDPAGHVLRGGVGARNRRSGSALAGLAADAADLHLRRARRLLRPRRPARRDPTRRHRPRAQPGDPPATTTMYGPRVPAVVVSPYSRPGGVSNAVCDHTSVLATIEAQVEPAGAHQSRRQRRHGHGLPRHQPVTSPRPARTHRTIRNRAFGTREQDRLTPGAAPDLGHNARLELVKELRVNRDVLNLTDGAADTQFVLLQEVAELIAVDQVNRRSAVARRLSLGFGREGTRPRDPRTTVA